VSVYEDGTRQEPWAPRPWAGQREMAVSDTMRLMSIPGEELAKIRPPVPYQLFPDQELGFVPEALTIEQVLDTQRWSPQIRSWLSPTIQPPTTRRDLTDDGWSGSPRGAGGMSA